jgi:hypothetical protein
MTLGNVTDKFYVKDLKKAYRILRKEKNQYPVGDEKRIELHRKMKELKEKINKETYVDPAKKIIIDKILSYYRKENRDPFVELEKFSVDDLEFHYYKITGKINTREDYKKLKEATK